MFRQYRFYPAWLIALALAKLVLVAHTDIVSGNRPHDDYWHILAANGAVWGRIYNSYTLAQLPVYAIGVAINGALGIPLRLTAELLYISGAIALALAMNRVGVARWATGLAAAFVIFHPDAVVLLNYSFAETGATIVTLFLIAALLRVIADPSNRWQIAAFSVLFAIMWFIRKESAALLTLLLIAIAAVLVLRWFRERDFGRLRQGTISMLGWPLVAVAMFWMGLSGANGLRYGMWAPTDFSGTNFLRAHHALQSIAVENPKRFIPVPKEARLQAYAVSPTFRELQPFLDGPVENWGATAGRAMGLDGDIGAGWFHWSLRMAVEFAGYYRDVPSTEAFYGRLADELDQGFADGRLKQRRAPLPFIDPEIAVWLPHLPNSLMRIGRLLYPDHAEFNEGLVRGLQPGGPEIDAVYDRVAQRRTAARQGIILSGWILPTHGQITGLTLLDVGGQPVPTETELVARPDVPASLSADGSYQVYAIGFTMKTEVRDLESARLQITIAEGSKQVSDPLATILVGKPYVLTGGTVLALDAVKAPRQNLRKRVLDHIVAWYPTAWLAASLATLAVAALAGGLKNGSGVSLRLAAAGILAVFIFPRVALFGVVDASAWDALQTRYLFPVTPLFTALPFVFPRTRRRSVVPVTGD